MAVVGEIPENMHQTLLSLTACSSKFGNRQLAPIEERSKFWLMFTVSIQLDWARGSKLSIISIEMYGIFTNNTEKNACLTILIRVIARADLIFSFTFTSWARIHRIKFTLYEMSLAIVCNTLQHTYYDCYSIPNNYYINLD